MSTARESFDGWWEAKGKKFFGSELYAGVYLAFADGHYRGSKAATSARLDAVTAERDKMCKALFEPPSLVQALGAAISRRDWHAVEKAYGEIRDLDRVPS